MADLSLRFVPRDSIAVACARRGRHDVVAGCTALLAGDDRDTDLIVTLSGPPAERLLSGASRADAALWYRVWALRGLLWAGPGSAAQAVITSLGDPAWRVREMACRVVARHRIDAALSTLLTLREDPVARPRAAAERAVQALTTDTAGTRHREPGRRL